ncbi:MAG: TatD family hydrolase [Candidatus Omnitrophica bacterium]|nr:TatD family hydrolase [Candidatus Omnitrophota bacterium]
MLIDTHCHLDFKEFDQDRSAVLAAAHAAGVEALINVGSSLEGSRRAVELARQDPRVFASVGIHPHDAGECGAEAFAEMERLAAEPKVVAIGEVGLDYYRNLSAPALQRDCFGRFLSLGVRVKKPLIIHCRDAEADVAGMLAPLSQGAGCGVVVHCFSGTEDFLKDCLQKGFFVSFTANITYKKADRLRELVRLVPLERMFLETDAPFLSPEGHRGRRNEPAHVALVAQAVAAIKDVGVDDVCRRTTQAARQFFGLP